MSDAEEHLKDLAELYGYEFGILTDGTIVLEKYDPECCVLCAAHTTASPVEPYHGQARTYTLGEVFQPTLDNWERPR